MVLPMLHGPFGEDGTMQGLLEMAGIRYVGAGVLASAVSMDKEYMKLIFKAKGLPVGPFVVVRDRDCRRTQRARAGRAPGRRAETERKRVLDAIGELGWPVFVKPARGGSSIGTSRADDLAGLYAAIETARRYDRKILVEQAIAGREIECAVLEGLDGAPPDTSMPGQLMVDGGEEFFDFEAKYLDDANGMAIPAPIPADHLEEVRRLAGRRVRGGVRRGAGPGGLLLHAGRRDPAQRDQHHARDDRRVVLSQNVGGQRVFVAGTY